jgi:hypothetical protein
MGVFAEFERAMIRERVLAGLARAKERGINLGRRRLEDCDAAEVAAIKRALAAKRGVRRATDATVAATGSSHHRPAVALGDSAQLAALVGGRLLVCRNAQIDGHPLRGPLALRFGHPIPRSFGRTQTVLRKAVKFGSCVGSFRRGFRNTRSSKAGKPPLRSAYHRSGCVVPIRSGRAQ